ncbi:MAG: hypothetical protein QM820_07810 [Minicystis sp.]
MRPFSRHCAASARRTSGSTTGASGSSAHAPPSLTFGSSTRPSRRSCRPREKFAVANSASSDPNSTMNPLATSESKTSPVNVPVKRCARPACTNATHPRTKPVSASSAAKPRPMLAPTRRLKIAVSPIITTTSPTDIKKRSPAQRPCRLPPSPAFSGLATAAGGA